jgi:metal-dependent amidase/aminoacylase/carboxypeptidase family protein
MAAIAELALPQPIEGIFPPPLRERLVTLRRALHAHPELSFEEMRTSTLVADYNVPGWPEPMR